MGEAIELTSAQRTALHMTLARYAESIDQVGVYGSRAMGRARPGSDVDLVLFGDLSTEDVGRISEDLSDSDLSIFADVVVYDQIRHAPLKAQIDQHWKPLFSRAELLAA